MFRRCAVVMAVVMSGASALAACGGGESTPTTTIVPTTTTVVLESNGVFRVRPIRSLLSIDNMPIGSFGSDDVDETMISANLDSSIAFDLGPALADESAIVTATAVPAGPAWDVVVTLDDVATSALRALAGSCLARKAACEQGRLAATVDGVVLADITVIDDTIGPEIRLSALLNEQQATAIAEALQP